MDFLASKTPSPAIQGQNAMNYLGVNSTMPNAPQAMNFPVTPTGSTNLPTPQKTPTGPTGVATSGVANDSLATQTQGTQNLKNAVDTHAANKAAAGGKILGYRPDISIVDLLGSKGQASDFESRAKLAQQAGIKDYVGSPDQNAQLIGYVNTGTGGTGDKTTTGASGAAGAGATDANAKTTGTNNTANGGIPQQPQTGSPGDQYSPAITQNQKDVADAYKQRTDQVTQIMNGTFPLSPYQQTILDTTQKQFADLAQQQMIANKSYENGVALSNNRLGLNIQNPQQYLAKQNQAVNDGLQKVASLDTQGAKTLAELHQSFLDKDYTMINDNYNALQKVLENKGKAIQDLQTRTDKLYTDARDYNEKVNEFQQNMKLEQQKLAQGSYSLHENADGSQSILNTKTGQVTRISGEEAAKAANATAGDTGVSILDGNTKTTYKNVPYIDGSSLSGKVAEDAQRQAAVYKIPYLGKEEAGAVDKLQAARANIYDINKSITDLLPKDATGRTTGGALKNRLAAYFQTDAEKASFNTWRSAAIGVLQSLAGGAGSGLRINQAEIALSVANDIPYITDTAATAQAKIAKVNAMMNNAEHSLMGSSYYDKFNPDFAVKDLDIFAGSSPEHEAQINQIHQANPSLTPYQVLQIAQP